MKQHWHEGLSVSRKHALVFGGIILGSLDKTASAYIRFLFACVYPIARAAKVASGS